MENNSRIKFGCYDPWAQQGASMHEHWASHDIRNVYQVYINTEKIPTVKHLCVFDSQNKYLHRLFILLFPTSGRSHCTPDTTSHLQFNTFV